MNLNNITPLILTFNEAPNIGRCLEKLSWARRIVVIDSFSTDETLAILRRNPVVEVFQNPFVHQTDQCNLGLQKITTEWVLSLDADYVLGKGLVEELEGLPERAVCAGYRVKFKYCIDGYTLRSGMYPPRIVLYRRSQAFYRRDGHTQRVSVTGEIGQLNSRIYHDDRKMFSRWYQSQKAYADLEAEKLSKMVFSELNVQDKLRRGIFLAPVAVALYCLFVKGLIFDGRYGLYYSFQRVLAEGILSLRLLRTFFRGH
jgi:glycosyltransferase involved in cell wall biosynthesis